MSEPTDKKDDPIQETMTDEEAPVADEEAPEVVNETAESAKDETAVDDVAETSDKVEESKKEEEMAADEEAPESPPPTDPEDKKEAGDEESPAPEKGPEVAPAKEGEAAEAPRDDQSNPKREVNPDFKDVHETGQWGSVSKKEKIVVGVVLAIIAIVVVVVVVVLVANGDDSSDDPEATYAPTPSPTPAPTLAAADELELMLFYIANNTITADTIDDFPTDPTAYEGVHLNETAPSNLRALSWILEGQSLDNPEANRVLYGLVTMYYALGGPGWTSNTNWLSNSNACGWFGVRCDRFNQVVEEIGLGGNNLVGEIPPEISFLGAIKSIGLQDNELTGSIPALAFAELDDLSILYLQDNRLTGRVLGRLRDADALSTLFVHNNDLTGVWPNRLCLGSVGASGASLENIGLDCDEITCSELCCPSESACL